jgi:hypothetical protein
VEAAAPPEADRSVLSQRMLINLTEALQAKRLRLSRAELSAESQRLARDQARLRRTVGDIIFTRLGGETSAEHAHDANAQDEKPLSKEELLKAAEAATGKGTEAIDFDKDETPVVAVNRPLLEAYNAMWDAGRELGVAAPDRALPHMYLALSAIQRARAAERLYLRGKAPLVVVDVARVRLQGSERGASSGRTRGAFADSADLVARRRFVLATAALSERPGAAIDSLLVLRLALLGRRPAAAAALDVAIAVLRAGRDATADLARARRALDAGFAVADSIASWNR